MSEISDPDSEDDNLDDDIDDIEPDNENDEYAAKKNLKSYIEDIVKEIRKIVNNNRADEPKEPKISLLQPQKLSRKTGRETPIVEEQKKIAENLQNMIVKKIPHLKSGQFKFFDMFIIVPYFISLGEVD